MLNDLHGQDHLVVVVHQLAHLLDGYDSRFLGQLYLEVLCDGGDQETGQGERGLTQDVVDEGFSNIMPDRETEGGLGGNVEGTGFSAGSSRGCGGVESWRLRS